MPAKPRARTDTRKIAAHHEAGHAVVALAFLATGLRASIKPRGMRNGWVRHDPLPYRTADVVLFITLAGPFAHRRFAPRSNWLTSDFNRVCRMIKGSSEKEKKYLASIVDDAEQIVDYFWTDIRVTAKALLEHETLTGDEILTVIRAGRRKRRRRRRVGDPPTFASPSPVRRIVRVAA
jgi:hypothetical protein